VSGPYSAPTLNLVDAVLDAGEGKVTMNLNGTKYTYNFLRVSKHPTPFRPEDEEVEEIDSLCFVKTLETRCKERWKIKLLINKMKN
jgi:hypothetical protein